ncbi:LOW QUALITY PROTEIN: olfactory receptor 14A16-like [Varanus komodoensis]|uniref:LOW QUALITY PROTEIN: olfactory receptor 14A16-like n=1 Tax=Varanus komodoensis TaxID=61221 RepID=UPI001CF7CB70|nr:LOW QUALITY PROTEIN: olfactory receptor 14A16-like [Varanus komodoensis]
MANQSAVIEFLLMGFSNDRRMQILHFVMFLFIYLIAVAGNFLVIIAVALDHHLHTPMYFFLVHLSVLDVCNISTTVPKSISNSLMNNKRISLAGCVTQIFLVVTSVGGELAMLTIMAYDRYVAICHPLQYSLIMNRNACIKMAAASWISNVIHGVLETSLTFTLNFCGANTIGQFFCDIPQLQKISCTDTKANELVILVLGFILDSFVFVFIFVSYGFILSAVLKIPSVHGRHKAFSTCTPHLAVFFIFIITGVFSYMRPKALSSPALDLVSAVLYAVLPPVLNPVIYSFRNKDIQRAVWKILQITKNLIA